MRIVRFSSAAVLALLVLVVSASAAPAPRRLGQIATAGKEIAACTCSAWQFSDLGTMFGTYKIPYDGVIVRSSVLVGEETTALDTFQAQSAHKTGANAGNVASEGQVHSIFGRDKTAPSFYERFPVHKDDFLGARFRAQTSFIKYTTAFFKTESAFEEIATKTPGLAAGESFTGSSNGTKEKVNMEGYLEPDEDHDGYGDVSQDLCPSNPIGGGPCSGSLFGTNFEGMQGGYGGVGSDSLYVQTALRGVPTAWPARGVVVRWRVLGGFSSAAEFQLRVLAPNGSGGYAVAGSSAVGAVPKNLGDEAGQIGSFETRLPIPAGGFVALATGPLFTVPGQLIGGPAGSTLSKLVDGADGTTYSGLPTTSTAEFGYNADIEPDADGDGYGDVTQDACPAAASTQTAPCPLPPAMPGPPATTSASAKPAISGFKATPKSFQIKTHGGGTKLKLTLSKAAKVTFTFEQKLLCETKGKARCKARFHALGSFSKSLPSGKSSVAFAGRVKGKNLIPGSYRVTAVAAAGGLKSAPTRTTLTVLAPPTTAAK